MHHNVFCVILVIQEGKYMNKLNTKNSKMLEKLVNYFIEKNYSAKILDNKVHCEIVTCMDIVEDNGQYEDKLSLERFNTVEEVEQKLLSKSKVKAETARQYYKNNRIFLNVIAEENEKKTISDKTVDLGYFSDIARMHGLISVEDYYSNNVYCYRILNGYEKFNPERYEKIYNILIANNIPLD